MTTGSLFLTLALTACTPDGAGKTGDSGTVTDGGAGDGGADSGSADGGATASPQHWYRLVEMSGTYDSGEAVTITYDGEEYDPGTGPVPRAARGFLWMDDDAGTMDIRMTVLTNYIPSGIISGQGSFTWEDDGAKLVLDDSSTWVYTASVDGTRLTLSVDDSDARNEASPGVLDTYVFELEDAPDNPIEGSWTLMERSDTDATLTPDCGLAQDLIVMQLYGTADGVWTLGGPGGMDFTLHIQEWTDKTCADAALLDLDMSGTGLCELDASSESIACAYNRTDQSGTTTHLYYDGFWTLDVDSLVVDVSRFASDTTDPRLMQLVYTRTE